MLFPSITKFRKTLRFSNLDKILRDSEIKPGDIVAELGCGYGHYVYKASKMVGENGIVYAIDIQKPILSHIKSKIKLWNLKNVKYLRANLEKIGSAKIPDNSVDLTILANTLYQAKNRKNIFLEAKRILKDSGRLLIIDWKKQKTIFGPRLDLRIDEKQLMTEIKELEFKFVKNIKTDDYHYGFLTTITK